MQVLLILFLIAVCLGLALMLRSPMQPGDLTTANSEDVSNQPSGIPLSPIGRYHLRLRRWETFAGICVVVGIVALFFLPWLGVIAFAIAFLAFCTEPIKTWRSRQFWDGIRFLLLVVAWPGLLFTGWGQVERDLPANISFFPVLDVVVGMLFALAFAIRRVRCKLEVVAVSKLVLCTVAVWLCISLPLLFVFEYTTKPNWQSQRKVVAFHRTQMIHMALGEYAKDCGSFPTQEQGLISLWAYPGAGAWRGPYIEANVLVDPWGNAIRFRVIENRVEVWSTGRDGVDQTRDDIRYPPNDQGRGMAN